MASALGHKDIPHHVDKLGVERFDRRGFGIEQDLVMLSKPHSGYRVPLGDDDNGGAFRRVYNLYLCL